MRPTLEYASSIWSPMTSPTSINKLQVMQNAALRACTGCTHDTNIQHLHDETNILPIQKHLQLHASQVRQKAQYPSHPLYRYTTHNTSQRLKKPTTFNNSRYTTNIPTDPCTVTTADIKANMRDIHTTIVSQHLAARDNNKILRTHPPQVSSTEENLPRHTRRTLAQLRTNKSPFLISYLHKIDASTHPSPLCVLCRTHEHTTQHLFSSIKQQKLTPPNKQGGVGRQQQHINSIDRCLALSSTQSHSQRADQQSDGSVKPSDLMQPLSSLLYQVYSFAVSCTVSSSNVSCI